MPGVARYDCGTRSLFVLGGIESAARPKTAREITMNYQQIFVWRRTPSGQQQRVGAIRVKDPDPVHGGLVGAFRYDTDYLSTAGAIPLDPIHLPLSPEVFEAHRLRAGVHGVFEDALPDEWGRALLVRYHQLSTQDSRVPGLLRVLGGDGLGALTFGEHQRPPRRTDPSAAWRDLELLVHEAEHYERSGILPTDPLLRTLLQAGSSLGGARPKALVREGDVLYVAKFPSAKDPVDLDMVRVESASLMLAQLAGIAIPESRVVLCGSRPVLLSRRFDVSDQGGRYHQISLQSLLAAEGYYYASYAQVADVVRQVSGAVDTDLEDLYRRIVFHAVLGHTDDHLKNILMHHDGRGYRLTPAFDLAPDVLQRSDHILSFGISGFQPSLPSLIDLGSVCGLSPEHAATLRDHVVGVLKNGETVFAQAGISITERMRYAKDIDRRIRLISSSDSCP